MEEIDITQLINYFKSKWIYIIFAMSIAFCLSSIYVNRFRVPEYTSSTTILLSQTNENSAINSADVSLNKSLVTTYSEIIKSKRVLRQVITELALDLEYEDLVDKVMIGAVTDTSIIRISVTDNDNTLAADIANSIASVFAKEIVEIYNIENISIIDAAEPSEHASSASTLKIIGIATVAGAVISIAVIFVVFYFDTTLKNEEDIERITGLPVIGSVPASREKVKYSAHRKYYEDLAKHHKTAEIKPIETEVRKIEIVPNVDRTQEISIKQISDDEYVKQPIEDDVTEIIDLDELEEARRLHEEKQQASQSENKESNDFVEPVKSIKKSRKKKN